MEQRNDKNNLIKNKFDTGTLLVSLGYDEDEYKKVFDKQIAGDKRFPPTLKNIPQSAP